MHATLPPEGAIAGIDIRSDGGLRQGGGMSIAVFCSLIGPVVRKEREIGNQTGDHVVFDIDDGHLSGPIESINYSFGCFIVSKLHSPL
jgi:hypothetical protein